MPTFSIRTDEYWLHRVDYAVQASTLEDAMQQILNGEVNYQDAAYLEDNDNVRFVCSVNGQELSESESNMLLAERIGRRRSQHP